MNNSKQTAVFGLIRAILSCAGAYLLGTNIFGLEANEQFWQEATGCVMGVTSVVWSISSNELTLEMVQGATRQTVVFIGGILIAKGKMDAVTLVTVLGVLTAISQPLYAYVSKLKSRHLDNGKISINQLKK